MEQQSPEQQPAPVVPTPVSASPTAPAVDTAKAERDIVVGGRSIFALECLAAIVLIFAWLGSSELHSTTLFIVLGVATLLVIVGLGLSYRIWKLASKHLSRDITILLVLFVINTVTNLVGRSWLAVLIGILCIYYLHRARQAALSLHR